MTVDTKPRKRHRATAAEWKAIREHFAGEPCWVCGGRPWHSLHHILSRGQGGDDVTVNLAPLCGSGATGCHGKIEARDPFARARLRMALMPSNLEYLRYRKGDRAEAWLDRVYPRRTA